MDAYTFWQNLDTNRRTRAHKMAEICERAGTTLPYFKHIANGRSRPSVDLAYALAVASGGQIDVLSLLKPKPRKMDKLYTTKRVA